MPDKKNSRRRAERGTQNKVTAVALSGLMLWQFFGACAPAYAATKETTEAQAAVASASLDYPVSPTDSIFKYDATIKYSIENANVAYFAYHTKENTVGVTANNFTQVSSTGTINLTDFNSSTLFGSTHGYVLFFVKQSDGYLLTGLGAKGNGEFYSLQDPKETFGSIKDYPGLSNVVSAAKAAGYIGVFGYSRKPGDLSLKTSFEVYGQRPSLTASAKVDKTDGVRPGDELTLTVTLNPQKPETEREVVLDGIKVVSAKVNGNDVTIDNLKKNPDGTYVGTVVYKVTAADCDAGTVKFAAKVSCTYSVSVGMVEGSEVVTSETVIEDASCESAIAPRGQVKYTFMSATQGMELPKAVTDCLPADDAFYYYGHEVRPTDPKPTEVKVADGTWTFAGWDKQSDTMDADGVKFTGKWEYAADSAAAHVTLTPANVAVSYDGKSHSAGVATATDDNGYDVLVEYQVPGTDTWTEDPSQIAATDVVGAPITVNVRASVKDHYDGYVTCAETLTISKRELTVTTESASKSYDGTPLTAPGRVEGLVDGETVELRLTGSQTEVGSSDNTYELAWTGSARETNYTVADGELGKLTVTSAPEVNPDEKPTVKPGEKPAAKPADNATSNKGAIPETGDTTAAGGALAAMGGAGLFGVIAAAVRRRRNRE